jgi:hypothetical protein
MKGLLRILLMSCVAISAFATANVDNAADAAKDPAYAQIKRLVGGVWHSNAGGTKVESRWKLGPDGVTLVGETIIGPDTKTPFHMNARFGWDPKTKSVYYLDAHGLDTVYFGHASVDKEETVLSFDTLVGSDGAFVFRTNYTGKDSYHAILYDGTDGKQGKVIETFDWMRTDK